MARGVTVGRAGQARRWRRLFGLAVAFGLLPLCSTVGTPPAFAGVGLAVTPTFPSPVSVGQTALPASLTITNLSTPPHNVGTVAVTEITLVPSCGTAIASGDCPGGSLDPGVFGVSPTAVGGAGTACAGMVFSTSLVDPAQGKVRFVPAAPVALGPPGSGTDTCRLDFTVDVLRVPAVDAAVAPGVQTAQLAFVRGIHTSTLTEGVTTGASLTTVLQATPSITTQVTPASGFAVDGDAVFDTATVTGVPSGPVPTGTVTFVRFFDPPGASPCSGPSTALGAAPLVPAGGITATATSVAVASSGSGTFRFVASYSGDANYAPLPTTSCGAPNENVVAQAEATISTQASPVSGTALSGDAVFDTAVVSGVGSGPTPTGTVTFTRYFDAPGAAPCSGPATVLPPAPLVAGSPPDATATSPSVTAAGPGTFRFVASYSGDANFAPLPDTSCGAANENVVVQGTPTITTQASPSSGTAAPGDLVSDTATVTGTAGGPVPTGTVTFTRFFDAPAASPCSGPSTIIGPAPLTPAGGTTATATSPTVAAAGPGTFRFVAGYSGDANYAALPTTPCGAPNENVTVQAGATISTEASPLTGTALAGDAVFDTALVSGVVSGPTPTGTVTFTRYFDPPGAAPCSGPATVLPPAPLAPSTPPGATATSAQVTATGPGTFRFVASYSGDANFAPLPDTPCGALDENVVVQGTPTIATRATPASGSAAPGQSVFDTATVTGTPGGPGPTGTVTFTRFFDPPGTAPCQGSSTVLGSFALTPASPATSPPSATATSPAVTASGAGTFRFVAGYSGDANYAALPNTPCGALNENVTVQATATVATQATPVAGTATPGQAVSDTATVTGVAGAPAPTGTVTFTRFFDAPGAAPCSGPSTVLGPVALTPVVAPPGSATATSPPVDAAGPGTFRFVVSYSGDSLYGPIPTTACNAPNESVAVGGAPAISTTASGPVTVGGQVRDTATLSGGAAPTGTITFTLFGPDNTACAGTPIFTSTVPVNGNGAYTSAGFTTGSPAGGAGGGAGTGGGGVGAGPATTVAGPTTTVPVGAGTSTAVGTYRWVARYSGDSNNPPAGPTACNDPAEAVVVSAVGTGITTTASPGVLLGGAVSDTATLTGGANPTGSLTFTAFGPDNATCSGAPAFTATVPVSGNGSYASGPFTPAAAGTYRWVARYGGDTDNLAAGPTACNDPAEQVVVRPRPTITVTKTAVPTSLPEPRGTFAFDVVVTNSGTSAVTISGLADDVYGNLATRAGSTCSTGPGTVLAPGGGYRCRFTGDFAGRAGDRQTDTVTAAAADAFGTVATASATATVTLTAAPPSISVTKTAAPTSRGEPGGTFSFAVHVASNGLHPATVTAVTDDVYGNLNGRGTCAIGATLAANGGTYDCAFTGSFFGNAGARQTDTVTVTVVDDQGQTASASGQATVVITDVPPTISVDVQPSPATRPEPGGPFSFDVVVTNRSFEPVTVTSLADSLRGNLSGRGTCLTGAILAANGGTYRCSFTADLTGEPRDRLTDAVTAAAVDDDGSAATATGAATVSLTDVPPTITASATPSPAALPAPGGTFVVNLTVTNTSFEPVTLGAVADGVNGGSPAGLGTCAPGVVMAANGGTFPCSFAVSFLGAPGASLVDQVVVAAADNDGSSTTALTTVTLSILPVAPPPPAPPTTAPALVTTVGTVPATTAPATTVPPTTAPATTVPPTTVPPTTVPPTTVPPTTVPPTTLSPPVSAQVAPPAEIRLDTPSGPPGGQVTAVGRGCTPGEQVALQVGGANVGSATAAADGSFTATFDLPVIEVGTVDVVARCGPVVLTTPVEIALQTDVEQGTSNLIVLVFFVLLLLAVSRRGGRGPRRVPPAPRGQDGGPGG